MPLDFGPNPGQEMNFFVSWIYFQGFSHVKATNPLDFVKISLDLANPGKKSRAQGTLRSGLSTVK